MKEAVAALRQKVRDNGIDLADAKRRGAVRELSAELDQVEFEAYSSGFEVQVLMSGNGTLKDVILKEGLIERKGVDATLRAVKEAIENAEEILRITLLSLQGVQV